MKQFIIDGKIYTFDVEQVIDDTVEYVKCRENGRHAFIDIDNGVQFAGGGRVIAEPYEEQKSTFIVPRGCHYWGGVVRTNKVWRAQW